ncbi:MAG TPA: GDP-mannose 4,6-dehydratase [Chthoniobacteraceae bacterium]|jgi:GDPmannose 4,6-dehydratase
MKRAIVVGSKGQDGRLLMERLQQDGCEAVGIGRQDCDLRDRGQVFALLERIRPDEVYYVPAYHHSSEDRIAEDDGELFRRSHEVHVTGLIYYLEAIKERMPKTRLFYAATSHIFGRPTEPLQDESTAIAPTNIYGITKATGVHCCRYYRSAHGVFAAAGILYNHESAYRRAGFVSQRIVSAAHAIRDGLQDKFVIGDLSARVDWGYAADYVEAMVRTLAVAEPDDFVVATGETHTVQEFVEAAFRSAGLDWRSYVVENASVITRKPTALCGNSAKLHRLTGWRPTVTFLEMISLLVDGQAAPKRDETGERSSG